jgi:hypothetical protein
MMIDSILFTGLLGRSESTESESSFTSSICSACLLAFLVLFRLQQQYVVKPTILPTKTIPIANPAICGIFRPLLSLGSTYLGYGLFGERSMLMIDMFVDGLLGNMAS